MSFVIIRRKTVKSAKNTILTLVHRTTFAHRVLISRRTVIQLRTQFVTIVHKTRGDMSFVTFLLIQLVIKP